MASKSNEFEIPAQMRLFAEKSVDQARKAWDDFVSATSSAVAKTEESASAIRSGAEDVNKQSMDFAQNSVTAAFDFAQKMVNAKDLQEVAQLQKDYMSAQMNALGEHSRKLGDTALKTAQGATRRDAEDGD